MHLAVSAKHSGHPFITASAYSGDEHGCTKLLLVGEDIPNKY
jgi:hypothetical protein